MAEVSVVIPVYNIQRHLRQCLDSVVGQTLRDLEILCVDDGSTDGSLGILREYEAGDSRVRVLTQPNAGPGAARNAGMALATGEYLIFLDSDDWFEPDFLERMAARARETGSDIALCRAVEFDSATGRELPSQWMMERETLPGEVFRPEEIGERLFQFTYGWPWDKLYRTAFVREKGLRYPELRNSEDLAFVFAGLAMAERICVLDRVMVHRRVNRSGSVSATLEREPEDPYRSAAFLRDALVEKGLLAAYEKSFLTWAVTFLTWHVARLTRPEQRRRVFRELKISWLPQLGCTARPASFYAPGRIRAKYLLVRYAPYPVFAAVSAAHRLLKRSPDPDGASGKIH